MHMLADFSRIFYFLLRVYRELRQFIVRQLRCNGHISKRMCPYILCCISTDKEIQRVRFKTDSEI